MINEDKYSTLSFSDIAKKRGASVIKNFIVSGDDRQQYDISFMHPYIVDGIAFLICLDGKARIKINLREYVIDKDTIMTIVPGSVFEVIEQSEDLLSEYIFFSFDFVSNIRMPASNDLSVKIDQSPCLKVSRETIEILLEFHAFIVKQYNRVDFIYRETMAKTLLIALMTEVASIYHDAKIDIPAPSSRKEELLNEFIRLIVEYYRQERTITFYADKMCLTPKYLAQIIKESSGKSALDWINEIVIVSIKAMLKSSTLTVLQISEELNFPNPSFFCRYFRKHTGMTPVQYREA